MYSILLLLICLQGLVSDGKDFSLMMEKPKYAKNTKKQETLNDVEGSSKRLTTYLLKNHLVASPPEGVIHIDYEMELVHIIGLDELKQTMTALVYRWSDPSLQWNPEAFGGLEKTWLPIKQIWLPDIIVFNMLYHDDVLTNIRAAALIYSNGTIEVSIPIIYTVSCEINVKNFPFDDQKCGLLVASWCYGNDKIKLHGSLKHSLDHYSQNEEWSLLNITVDERNYDHEGINVSELEYNVFVQRKPLFYITTLALPSYVMCVIAVVGLFARFSTTSERQERFTLGVTAILTMAVLLLIVGEKVPHSSTAVPLLVGYFLFNMVTVSLAAITTGIIMRVHRRGKHRGSPCEILRRIFFIYGDDKMVLATESDADGFVDERRLNSRSSSMSLERRTSYQQWILLSERLEWAFLIFFIAIVTVPFFYFLSLMWFI